jgi:hypothetical protein
MFPARMYIAPKSYITLTSAADFDVAQVPRGYYSKDDSFVMIPIDSENGIEFDATIHLKRTIFSNTLTLTFTSEHIDSGLVTLTDLKAMLAELIPVFEAHRARVYDTEPIVVPHPSGGWAPAPRKVIRTPDGKVHRLELEWIRFFGPEALALIGRGRFDRLRTYAEKYELHGGLVIVLQEEPFDWTNPAHRQRVARAEEELGFEELVSS